MSAAIESKPARKGSRLSSVLRIVVSVGLIAFVLSGAELEAVIATMAEANPGLIAVAFLSYFLGYVLSVARWSLLLRAHGAQPRFGYLYLSFMIGMFFNQLLPSTVGGDVARYHYTSSLGRGAAFSSVLMDRAFGLVSLMLFAFMGLLLAGRFGEITGNLFEAVAALLAIGLAGIGTIFMLSEAAHARLKALYAPLPAKIVGLIDKVIGVFEAYRGRLDIVVSALLISLALQCVVIAHYVLVGAALGLDVPIHAYLYVVPLAIVIMMLPISINGIGVRESIFVYLFGLYGADPNQVLAFAWIVYALILAHGLVGGLVFALVKRAEAHSGASH